MLRFDNIVFGPIKSRRLGTSLGINLLPENGKICNFDCIYCECGWNSDGRTSSPFPSVQTVVQALHDKLECMSAEGCSLDSITFSGHGEPTLHPDFAEIIDKTLELRDEFYPLCKVSVLSNATMLHRQSVADALKKVDNPILKIDGPDNETVAAINKPQGAYDVDDVVERLAAFNGDFILQTMMLGAPQFDYRSNPEALEKWKNIVRRLRPRMVMVYTLDRQSPQKDLEKIPRQELEAMLADIKDELNIKIY